MKYSFIYILLALVLFSCKEDDSQQLAATQKMEIRNDSILKSVSNNWKFDVPPPSARVQERIGSWNEWAQFIAELEQRPTGTLSAFRQKTEGLIKKAEQVRNTVPPFFNKPQLRSRISVLDTKVKSLYTYMALDAIQCEKITAIIKDVAVDAKDIQDQMDEMVRFSEIPKEQGEQEMLRARDTVRLADPDAIPQPGVATPRPEANPDPKSTDIPQRKRLPFSARKLKPAN